MSELNKPAIRKAIKRLTEVNKEGMTFLEWVYAADVAVSDENCREVYAAWNNGEDPTEWKAAKR